MDAASAHHQLRHSWVVGMEALDTIHSYSEEAALQSVRSMEDLSVRLFSIKLSLPYDTFFDAIPPSRPRFFRGLKPFHPTPDVICVHGGMSLDGILDPADDNVYVWGQPNTIR